MTHLVPAELKVVELRTELQKRGLLTKGLKSELVARLDQAMADELALVAENAERAREEEGQQQEQQQQEQQEQQPHRMKSREGHDNHDGVLSSAGQSREGDPRNVLNDDLKPPRDELHGHDRRRHRADYDDRARDERSGDMRTEEPDAPERHYSRSGRRSCDRRREDLDEAERVREHGDSEREERRRHSRRAGGAEDYERRSRTSTRRRDEADELERRNRGDVGGYETGREGHRVSGRDRRYDNQAESFLSQFGERSLEDDGRDDQYNEHRSSRRDRDRDRDRRSRYHDHDYDDASNDRRSRRSDRDRDRDRERDRGDRDRDYDRDRGYDRDRDREGRRSRRDDVESRGRRRGSPRGSRSPRYLSRSRSITPLNKRPKRLHNWDVVASGFEHMTTEQAKNSGVFPLPGQPGHGRATAMAAAAMSGTLNGMDPGRAAMMMQHDLPPRPPGMDFCRPGLGAPLQGVSRQARRLYVGQIPYGITEEGMMNFFNDAMICNGLAVEPGNPVISVQINQEKNYAFVEFRNPVETTAAVAFDGIQFEGQSLKIRRPKDYAPPTGEPIRVPSIHLPGVISTNVPDGPHKIFLGGLPPYLNEDQVIELLKSFGELRAFNLVKDTMTGVSKGFAFCEYANPGNTDIAIQGLNNLELGDKRLVVQRASVGSRGDARGSGTNRLPVGMPCPGLMMPTMLPPMLSGSVEPTTVLQLLNMVTKDELANDEDYADIMEDIRDESVKFGNVLEVKIPRPLPPGAPEVPGVGKIFVRYETAGQASAALRALSGRKFADRTVLTSFIREQDLEAGNY